ncbi:MAG: PAS domain S-box protein [Candidatus Lokiarchaeota archaeon]|nr:PAS domain S-box protein [Candidatus Lokiarchaeota archaeon]
MKEFTEKFPLPLLILKYRQPKIILERYNKRLEQLNSEYIILPQKRIKNDMAVYDESQDIDNLKDQELGVLGLGQIFLRDPTPKSRKIFSKFYKRIYQEQEDKNNDSKIKNTIFRQVVYFYLEKNTMGIILINFQDRELDNETTNLNLTKLALFNDIPNGIFILENNEITFSNDNFISLLGYNNQENVIKRRIEEFIYPTDLHDFITYLKEIKKNNPSINQDKNKEREFRFIKKNGDIIWFTITFHIFRESEKAPISIIFSVLNITERKKAELALLQTHRLASIGELTSSIAHEINNPVFGIMNYAALIKDSIDSGRSIDQNTEDYEFLEGIRTEAERISNIINNLSEFTRKVEERKFEPTDLQKIINNVEKLLAYQIKHAFVTIKKDIPEDLPEIILQPYRIQQVIFNLVLNAIQALEKVKREERVIQIVVKINKKITPHQLIIEIIDNGEGIPDKNFLKIFHPFFSTRPASKATGLGLYTVYNIVNEHGGEIKFDSEFHEWTQFKLEIPIGDK